MRSHCKSRLPVDKHSSTAIETLLDEVVGGGEVLKDILILNIIHFDHKMLVTLEQIPIQRQAQG